MKVYLFNNTDIINLEAVERISIIYGKTIAIEFKNKEHGIYLETKNKEEAHRILAEMYLKMIKE